MLAAHCKARRYNDEYNCSACGLTWAVDDKDAPECKGAAPAFDDPLAPAAQKERIIRAAGDAGVVFSKNDKITAEMWADLRRRFGGKDV